MPMRKLLASASRFWQAMVAGFVLAFMVTGVAGTQARSLAQSADAGAEIFQSKCSGCHTIGGGVLVGPDLQGVTERQDVEWLRQFIQNPDQVIASGDPIATQLLQDFNNLPMPNLGLSDQEVGDLIAFLESQSKPAGTPTEATTAPPQPELIAEITGDPGAGLALFTGKVRLANGGPACMACHSVAGAGALGGGSLGPDLTLVADRYGEAGLAGVLQTLSFKVMQDVYAGKPLTPQEQADLVAYFTHQAGQGQAGGTLSSTTFMGYGGVIGAALFLVMFILWRRQRHGIATRMRQQS